MLFELFILLSVLSFGLLLFGIWHKEVYKSPFFALAGATLLFTTGFWVLGDNIQIRTGEQAIDTTTYNITKTVITDYSYSVNNATGTPELTKTDSNSTEIESHTNGGTNTLSYVYSDVPAFQRIELNLAIFLTYIFLGMGSGLYVILK